MLFCYFMLCIRWTGPLEQKLWHCALLIATTQKICPSLVVTFSPSHPQRYSPNYRQTSDISRTLVGNKIVDHPHVVGASPVGAASTTSLFSTYHLASMDWAKVTSKRDEKHLNFGFCAASYIRGLTVCIIKWPIIGSDDGLLPVRTKRSYNFSEIWIRIVNLSFWKVHFRCCLQSVRHFLPASICQLMS